MLLRTTDGLISVAAKPVNSSNAYRSEPVYSFAGQNMNLQKSVGIPAFYAAGMMVSNTVSSMRLQVIDKNAPRGNQVVTRGDMPRLLQHQPNDIMSGTDVWHFVSMCLLFRGNAYLAKIKDVDGVVRELIPLRPDTVSPYRNTAGEKVYRVRLYDGETHIETDYSSEAILHIKGASVLGDILCGDSVVSIMRHNLGAQISQIEYQAKTYENGLLIKGVLSTPDSTLNPEAVKRMKQQWRHNYSGVQGSGDIAVLHNGMKFEPISLTPEDAQFIQTRKWSNTEVALMFQIPASRLNGETSTGTYQNQTQDDLVYYQQAVMPHVNRIEAALNMDKDLFGIYSPWEPRFNEKDVLRSDIKTRFEAYRIGRENGFLSANDVREAEEMPTIVGGDDYTPLKSGGANVAQ